MRASKTHRKKKKASAKNSSKLNKFSHSEVNQLIQHIIVQDQDGQNNTFRDLICLRGDKNDMRMKIYYKNLRFWR